MRGRQRFLKALNSYAHVYKELTKPNHRIFNPKKEDERESPLLLFVPFRNEAELIEEGEKAHGK